MSFGNPILTRPVKTLYVKPVIKIIFLANFTNLKLVVTTLKNV